MTRTNLVQESQYFQLKILLQHIIYYYCYYFYYGLLAAVFPLQLVSLAPSDQTLDLSYTIEFLVDGPVSWTIWPPLSCIIRKTESLL